MDALQIIREVWGFTGLKPVDIIDRNQFGNLILRDKTGRFWRICPEELTCKVVASSENKMRELMHDPEFKQDWEMTGLVLLAYNTLGEVADESCYYFINPPALGGEYAVANMGITTIADLMVSSGDMAAKMQEA